MDIFNNVKKIIKRTSVEKHYNKEQIYNEYSNLPELLKCESEFKDKLLIKKIILRMPTADFCKIVGVIDCEVSKYSTCICTKVMVFGGDEVNGKICDRFVTKATSRSCDDGNFKLVQGQCMASLGAVPCEEILNLVKEIEELKKENLRLSGELNEWLEAAEVQEEL